MLIAKVKNQLKKKEIRIKYNTVRKNVSKPENKT